MELSKETLKLIANTTNISHLKLFIKEVLDLQFSWIDLINDLDLLKNLIRLNLFESVEKLRKVENISTHVSITGLGEKNTQKLYNCNVLNENIYNQLIQNTKKKQKKAKNKKGWKKRKL